LRPDGREPSRIGPVFDALHVLEMEFDPMVLACSAIQPCHLLHLRAVVQARDDRRYAHFPLKPWFDGLKCGNAFAVRTPMALLFPIRIGNRKIALPRPRR
jgi:hypothetical protein